jgi:hypothetical protein
MTVLRAFLRGGIGGLFAGFLFAWLSPIFTGAQPITFGGVWAALCGVSWLGVSLSAAFFAGVWAWYSFWYDTNFGNELRSWCRLFFSWRP